MAGRLGRAAAGQRAGHATLPAPAPTRSGASSSSASPRFPAGARSCAGALPRSGAGDSGPESVRSIVPAPSPPPPRPRPAETVFGLSGVSASESERSTRPAWAPPPRPRPAGSGAGAESLSEEWSENACGSRKRPPAARAFTNSRPLATGEADAGTGSAAPRDRGRSADPRAPGAAILLSTSLRNSVAMNLQRRPIGQKVHALSAQASIASPLAPQASILPHSHTSPFGNPEVTNRSESSPDEPPESEDMFSIDQSAVLLPARAVRSLLATPPPRQLPGITATPLRQWIGCSVQRSRCKAAAFAPQPIRWAQSFAGRVSPARATFDGPYR
jgi:hypothetical protein